MSKLSEEQIKEAARKFVKEHNIKPKDVETGNKALKDSSDLAKVFVRSLAESGHYSKDEILGASKLVAEFCEKQGWDDLLAVAACACIFGAGCHGLMESDENVVLSEAALGKSGNA